MQFEHVTFTGPPPDDPEVVARLPADLAELLFQVNGFVAFDGGLHVRGACRQPAWHSLRKAWLGEHAFHRLYPALRPEDVPFAEDCLGDQFVLRDGLVWRLAAETGAVESLGVALADFLRAACADPVTYLALQPLLRYQQDGGRLEPGQLLSAAPPFCTAQSGEGVSLRAVPSDDRHRFLASLAEQLRDVPDGQQIVFELEE